MGPPFSEPHGDVIPPSLDLGASLTLMGLHQVDRIMNGLLSGEVEITFRDMDLATAKNAPPKRHVVHQPVNTSGVAQRIRFIVHLQSHDFATPLALTSSDQTETRKGAFMHSAMIYHEDGSLVVARQRVNLEDVIGVRLHPDKHALMQRAFSRVRTPRVSGGGFHPKGSARVSLGRGPEPTFVVHVPAKLNPGYQV